MRKVGPVVNLRTGSYCDMTLDSGERIVVSHEPGRRGLVHGRLAVERLKLMGFSSEPVVRIALDTLEGQAILAKLRVPEVPGTLAGTLRRFVEYLQGCRSVAEIAARCRQLDG
jgi:hypothetical protein